MPLLSTKLLDELPPRILRFRLRLMKYDFYIHHIPGKNLNTADSLSRAPTSSTTQDENGLQDEAAAFVAIVTKALPATDQPLAETQACQERDKICSAITSFCADGWPEKYQLTTSLKLSLPHRAKFNLNYEGLLLCGQRIVIPAALQTEVLQQLHTGHQWLTKCRQRAQLSTWWPGLSTQLTDYVRRCTVCARKQTQHAEPLISSDLPSLPWQRIAADFFEFKSHTYLLMIDYYSRFVKLALMSSMTSLQTIVHLRSIFARHGYPDEVVMGNRTQFSSREFSDFAKTINMKHTTSSLLFPQSNGLAERSVKRVKSLLFSSTDPYEALLSYR